jgi:hypothetical protein
MVACTPSMALIHPQPVSTPRQVRLQLKPAAEPTCCSLMASECASLKSTRSEMPCPTTPPTPRTTPASPSASLGGSAHIEMPAIAGSGSHSPISGSQEILARTGSKLRSKMVIRVWEGITDFRLRAIFTAQLAVSQIWFHYKGALRSHIIFSIGAKSLVPMRLSNSDKSSKVGVAIGISRPSSGPGSEEAPGACGVYRYSSLELCLNRGQRLYWRDFIRRGSPHEMGRS